MPLPPNLSVMLIWGCLLGVLDEARFRFEDAFFTKLSARASDGYIRSLYIELSLSLVCTALDEVVAIVAGISAGRDPFSVLDDGPQRRDTKAR